MTCYAVIGDPVAQSLSPKIHSYWMKQYGLDATYNAIIIPSGDLEERVQNLINEGYGGWNVTIPHKVAMMALCQTLDEAAQAIQAVNTIRVVDGVLHGFNTDAVGAITHLDQTISGWDRDARQALIIGAGGAARAIHYGLRQRGIDKIFITSRTQPAPEIFPGALWVPWAQYQDCLGQTDLLIQTTPLGMTGQQALDFDLKHVPETAIIYDIVYKPLITPLLAQAQARNLRFITGLGMLLHQARAAFSLWFGIDPAIDSGLMRVIGMDKAE